MASKAYKIAFKLDAMLSKGFGKTFDEAESRFALVGDKVSSVGKGLTLGVTTPLLGVATASVLAARNWESSWVGVRKVTKASEEDLQSLEATARQMARELPHTHAAIAGVFEAGSRLGVGIEYLEDFSRTMLAVEATTTLTLDSAANGFAIIANIMGTSQGDFDRMGSTILYLGSNFATTEAAILGMSQKMAGAASQARLSEADVMGISTAISAIGLSSAAGGSSFSQFISDMTMSVSLGGDRLNDFARIAGLSADEFARKYEVDAMSAIMAFIGGLNRIEAQGGSTIVTLDELGLNSIYMQQMLLGLSGAYDTTVDAINRANSAWDENNFLMYAVEERYATMEARMQIMQNQLRDAGITIGESLMPFVERGVEGITRLVEWFSNLDEGTQQNIIRMAMLAAAIGPVLMVTGKLIKFVGKARAAYATFKATVKAVEGVTNLAAKAERARTAATTANTTATELANIAAVARKTAKAAETKAIKLAVQAETIAATAGAGSAKATAAATAAEQARTAANAAAAVASTHKAAADKAQSAATKISTAASKHDTAAKKANILASTKLGMVTAFLTKKRIAATGSLKAYSATLAGLTIKQKIFAVSQKIMGLGMGILTKGLGAAKIGLIAFKKVLISTGIGAIVVGVGLAIAGLVAGITALVRWSRRVGEEYAEMGEEAERLRERQETLTNAAADAAARFEENSLAMAASHTHVQDLADRIEYLSSKTDLSAGEMERLEHYIQEMNSSVPGLALAYDAYAGSLNMAADSMHAFLAYAQGREQLNAMIDESLRLDLEYLELQAGLVDTIQARERIEAKLNDGTRRRRADRKALESALDDLIAAEQAYNESIRANLQMQADLAAGIEVHADVLRDLEAAQQEASAALAEATHAMEEQARKAEQWEQAQSQALDKINQSFENYKRLTTNVFHTVSESAAVSVQEMTANLIQNANVVEEWSKNMAILNERFAELDIDEALLEQLRAAGPEAAATIEGLVNATDYELEALSDAFENSTRVAVESMQRELDPTGIAQSAEELLDHVASAIMENKAMEEAIVEKVGATFAALNSTIANTNFASAGARIASEISSGISGGSSNAVQATANIPMFAKGSDYTPKTFIAGEAGPELITDAAGSKVFTALETGNIFRNVSSGVERALSAMKEFMRFPNLNADDDNADFGVRPIDSIRRMDEVSNYSDESVEVHYSPQTVINGSGLSPEELKQAIKQAQKEGHTDFKRIVNQVLDERKAREKRVANG